LKLFIVLCFCSAYAVASYAADIPQITVVRAGFAGRYKVGLNTPLHVTVRGGSSSTNVRARATTADSDGLDCTFNSTGPCQVPPGQEATIPLCVRFGHETSSLKLELLDDEKTLATKTIVSSQTPSAEQIPDALRPGQRLVVSAGAMPGRMDGALPSSEGKSARKVLAVVDDFADLPDCWQGYEGVDYFILSTSRRELLAQAAANPSRIGALDQWVRMGGTLVLAAGENAEAALGTKSPLAPFVPGRFDGMAHLHEDQVRGLETLANGQNPIPPAKQGEKVDLLTAKLADVNGRIDARASDIPLIVHMAHGLGQVVFVAVDLDHGSMLAWNDRPRLMASLLGLPGTEPPSEARSAVESYGYDDLAGQLRSSLELFRGVRMVPFFVVAALVATYILLIGPGDYFLLRRLRRGMERTWITFPAVVVLVCAGGYWASSWLKRDVLRVNQVDLIDIDADGTARGASWFSIFSPRSETFELSLKCRLPNGDMPKELTSSLGWFGKAGNGFNGMYNRDTQNSGPLGGEGYSIGPSMESAHDVPVQVWSCKNFVYRWLGRAGGQGLTISLKEESHQPSGTIANDLRASGGSGGKGVTLTHTYLAYDGWAYLLGTIRPGETVNIDSSTRRVSLNTFLSSESIEDAAGQTEKQPYDPGSRDAAYVLRAMLFYDAANGHKRTGMTNDYQGFADLSSAFQTGRAVLVAMPPQEEAYRGAEVLDKQRPLTGPLDKPTIIYRFVVPVGKQ
jgi:hypothetical protein